MCVCTHVRGGLRASGSQLDVGGYSCTEQSRRCIQSSHLFHNTHTHIYIFAILQQCCSLLVMREMSTVCWEFQGPPQVSPLSQTARSRSHTGIPAAQTNCQASARSGIKELVWTCLPGCILCLLHEQQSCAEPQTILYLCVYALLLPILAHATSITSSDSHWLWLVSAASSSHSLCSSGSGLNSSSSISSCGSCSCSQISEY